MHIQELSSQVIGQIAAGEVVERPAHLLKELVENAIDAKATALDIDFDQGGRSVKVKDNGEGLNSEDLKKVFRRHSTSKIIEAKDLWKLQTFGFRGEALASISSVSRVEFVSRNKKTNTTYQIKSDFGKETAVLKTSGEEGTSVFVQELFANVPARLKFLKSEKAETTQIKNMIKAMALSHPEIEFRVRQKGELLYYWPAQTLKERVETIFNMSPLLEGEATIEGVTAKAVFSPPHKTSRTSKQIWLFAQNRWIQDRSLNFAVMEAYQSLLMHGEYPFAAVFLTCPTEDIDVNIHPTKSQVKFKNPSHAFRATLHSLKDNLQSAQWIKGELFSDKPEEDTTKPFSGSPFQNYQYATKKFHSSQKPEQKDEFDKMVFGSPAQSETQPFQGSQGETSPADAQNMRAPEAQHSPQSGESHAQNMQQHTTQTQHAQHASHAQTEDTKNWSSLQVLGQANLTYLVTQNNEDVFFIDQHAAHERVCYETLMAAWKKGNLEKQSFLIPLAFTFEPEVVEAILQEQDNLEKMGLTVDQNGANSLAVREAPAILKPKAIEEALCLLAKEISEHGNSFAFEKQISHVCATLACHSAIRSGQVLSYEEMKNLLYQMDEFPLSSFCPHGRPVFVRYPFKKLEKEFGRIV